MSAPREAAARRPLVNDVAERIQRKILAGPLHAGDRLPGERALAVELGVNRGSVREALKKLEQLRLIEIQQGSGIRVRKLENTPPHLPIRGEFSAGDRDQPRGGAPHGVLSGGIAGALALFANQRTHAGPGG